MLRNKIPRRKMASVFTQISTFLRKKFNFYSTYISNYRLLDKILISKGGFIPVIHNEIFFLSRVRDQFGNHMDFTHGFIQRETFIAHLTDIEFLGNTGAVQKDLRIIAESCFDIYRLSVSKSYRNISLLRKKNKKGTYTSILHLSYARRNIYHWTIDCLPRLYNINKIPGNDKIYLIVNANPPAYQKEALSFFLKNNPRLELVTIEDNEKWALESYWLPSFATSNQSGYMPSEYIEFIKNTIREGYKIKPENHEKRKIYISRKLSVRRKMINEQELENYLFQKGYEIICSENLTYKEQVKIYTEADIIISPHGAGLTNIIYSDDATIIEIHPKNYVQSHYFMLSKGCGHSYYSFLAGELSEKGLYQLNVGEFDLFLSNLNMEWNRMFSKG